MKNISIYLSIMLCFSVNSFDANASDKNIEFPIEPALTKAKSAKKFNQNIPIYFSSNETPSVERLHKDVTLEATSMTVLQDDDEACEKAFKDVLLSMQKEASRLGANAVVNVKSYQDNTPYGNNSAYECTIGSVVGKVVLYGEVVSLQ